MKLFLSSRPPNRKLNCSVFHSFWRKKAVDVDLLVDGTVITQHFIDEFVIGIFAAGCQYCRHKKKMVEIV